MIPYILLYLMVAVYFASLWKIFEKNGRQSWEGLFRFIIFSFGSKSLKNHGGGCFSL